MPNPELPPINAPVLNLPPLSPGVDTSEYALIEKITKTGQTIAIVAGSVATVLASLALPPLAVAIPAVIGGLGQLAALIAPLRYSKDRAQLKAAVVQAQQIAQDAKPIVEAIKARK